MLILLVPKSLHQINKITYFSLHAPCNLCRFLNNDGIIVDDDRILRGSCSSILIDVRAWGMRERGVSLVIQGQLQHANDDQG